MTSAGDTPNSDLPQASGASPALKVIVYGLGFLMVVMAALLVIGLSLGWHKKDRRAEAPPAPQERIAASAAPGEAPPALEIATAPGARLYTLAGDGARIALHIASPTGDEVVVIDTAQNRVVSRIRLVPPGAQ